MYTVSYEAHKQTVTMTDLTLERAIVYKKRMKRRGVIVNITDQDNTHAARSNVVECRDGVCGFSWHPVKNCTI